MKYLSLFFLCAILFSNAQPQDQSGLFIPLNIKQAYDAGTRSLEGVPGPDYWQNRAEYDIKVQIDPETRILTGSENITYFNNSPDTLKMIVIRLYQDFYKKGNARDWQINPIAVTEGVEFSKIEVGGENYDPESERIRRFGTNMLVVLDEKLNPGNSLDMAFDWEFIIPKESGVRMGTYDSSSFFVAYWYPQVSVYDDVDGWDRIDYKGTVEMYNDFNDYRVEITMPENYIVWATGLLQNPENAFEEKYLKRYNEAWENDGVTGIIKKDDLGENVTKENAEGKVTYIYEAENVPDFAFATSHTYLWDLTAYDAEGTGKVLIGAAYNPESEDFYDVAKIARLSIAYFSEELPGVPYPYPSMTVFNGSGGMEFPMMVNDGSTESYARTVHLTSHEIAHTYFPFYMGTNEKKYAFMDEGWAVMIPYDFQAREAKGYEPDAENALMFSAVAGTEDDMPLMVPSNLLEYSAYRTSAYRRSAAAYDALRKELGDEVFQKALEEYIETWKGKHPLPYDFFNSFERSAERDLDWLWNPWFFERNYSDVKIKEGGTDKSLTIVNEGGLPVPLKIRLVYEDGSEEIIEEKPSVWEKDNIYTLTIDENKKPDKVIAGGLSIPDTNPSNNVYSIKGK